MDLTMAQQQIVREKKKYDVLEPDLNNLIKECVSLKQDDKTRYHAYLDDLLKSNLISAMRTGDKLFDCTYKRLLPVGSYYKNLKVGSPLEYDYNIELSLPASCEIVRAQPGYLQVRITSINCKSNKSFADFTGGEDKVRKFWLDENNFLDTEKVTNWMQGVMVKGLTKLESTRYQGEVKCRRSGPSWTLVLTPREEGLSDFSVDLVPVFAFGKERWPKHMRQSVVEYPTEAGNWCIVPKPPKRNPSYSLWRPSFYMQEERLLNGKNDMKKALKLIKLLRDTQGWYNLSSYYIETVFLWEVMDHEEHFWHKASASFLFIRMLNRLVEYLEEKSIPLFWDSNLNLLGDRDPDEVRNIYNRIKRILKKVEDNPGHVLKYFPSFRYESTSCSVDTVQVDYDDEDEGRNGDDDDLRDNAPLGMAAREQDNLLPFLGGVVTVVGIGAAVAGISWLMSRLNRRRD